MAETLSAQLQLDTSAFQSALTAASQQITAFAQQVAQALSQANAAMQSLTTALNTQNQATQQVNQTTNTYNSTLNTTNNIVNNITNTTNRATTASNLFGSSMIAQIAAGVGLATTIQALVRGFIGVAESAVSAASQMQTLTLAFSGAAGGALAGAAALQSVRETANQAGLSFVDLAQQSRVFEQNARSAGLTQAQTNTLLQQTALYLRTMGGDTTTVTQVLRVFSTELNRGNITTGELTRRLGTLLPGAMGLFQEATGKSREELLDLGKAGDLVSNTTLVRLGEAMERNIGDKSKEVANLASTQWAKMKNDLFELGSVIGEALLPPLLKVMDIILAIPRAVLKAKNDMKPDIGPAMAAAEAAGINTSQLSAAQIEALRKAHSFTVPLPGEGSAFQPKQEDRDALQALFEEIHAQQTLNTLKTTQATLENGAVRQIEDAATAIKKIDTILRGMQSGEAGIINRVAASVGIDPAFLAALRRAENGGPGREFGVLSMSAPTYLDQATIAAQSIKASLGRFDGTATDPQGRYTSEFIDFFSSRYAPLGAANDPQGLNQNHAANLKRFYGMPEQGMDFSGTASIGFGSTLTTPLEKAKEQAKAMDEEITKIQDVLKALPGLEEQLSPALHDNLVTLEAQRKLLGEQIEEMQKAPAELKRQVREIAEIAHARAAAEEQDIADEEKRHDIISTLDTKLQKEQESIQEALTVLSAKATQSRVDDFQAGLDKMHAQFVTWHATQGQLDQLALEGNIAKQRIQSEEVQKEIDKQQKAYEQLAQDIARPLASVFDQLLTNTGNILDTLKQMFLRFLAELASAALAHAVVIPILAQVFGSGGSDSGSGGNGTIGAFGDTVQAAPSLVGGTSSGLGGGGSGVLGLAGTAASAGGLLKGILNTPLSDLGIGVGSQDLAAAGGDINQVGTTSLGDTTLGSAVGGIATGMVVGSITNTFIYGKNMSQAEQIGGTVGGIAGGLVGTYFAGPVGGAIGAFLGELLGAFVGSLFTKQSNPQFQVTGVQQPGVSYSNRFGLQLSTPFAIQGSQFTDLGAVGINGQGTFGGGAFQEFTLGIESSMNNLFKRVLGDFSNAAPQIQDAIAGTLDQEFKNMAAEFQSHAFHGSKLVDFVQEELNTVIPTMLSRDLQPLTEAVQRINPIVLAFNQIIKTAQDDIVKLQQAATQQHLSLQTSIVGVQEGLFSPAQTFVARQNQLQQALGLLQQATPQQQTLLIPQIQQLATQVFGLAQNQAVLGQDPQALRNLQTQLVGTLQGLQGTSLTAFGSLAQTTAQQANLANTQIQSLLTTLPGNGGMTSTRTPTPNDLIISAAVDQLQAIQATMASMDTTAQTDANAQTQLALLTGQVASLQSIDTTEQQALAELQNIANILLGAPQHAAGINYVPVGGLAWLHAGERVLSASENASGGGGGGDVIIHVNGVGHSTDALVDKLIAKIEQKGGRLGNSRIMVRN